jgi:uncharacterized membrane protein YphA (DoxX/SURF4 family)
MDAGSAHTSAPSASSSADQPARWRWLGTAGGVLLGAVLLFAAWTKALDPAAFAEQIEKEGLAFLLSAEWMAVLALALEVGLGLALLLGLRRRAVLAASSLLVAFFLVLTGRSYWMWLNGETVAAACGCFGNFVQRTPAQAFWQDLLLLVPPLLLAWLGRPGARSLVGLRWAAVGVATVGMTWFAWKAPSLPLDDLATRVKPGVKTAELCVQIGPVPAPTPADPEPVAPIQCLDGLIPETDQGRHYVVLGWLADRPETAGLVDQANSLAAANPSSEVWLLASGELGEIQMFEFLYGPSFRIRVGPESLLRGMYRQLPRTFRLDDGVVTATWSGVPVPGTPDA